MLTASQLDIVLGATSSVNISIPYDFQKELQQSDAALSQRNHFGDVGMDPLSITVATLVRIHTAILKESPRLAHVLLLRIADLLTK